MGFDTSAISARNVLSLNRNKEDCEKNDSDFEIHGYLFKVFIQIISVLFSTKKDLNSLTYLI